MTLLKISKSFAPIPHAQMEFIGRSLPEIISCDILYMMKCLRKEKTLKPLRFQRFLMHEPNHKDILDLAKLNSLLSCEAHLAKKKTFSSAEKCLFSGFHVHNRCKIFLLNFATSCKAKLLLRNS